ncbi:MAG: hypothetical protein ACM3H8_11245 [Sphingobacteriales bacterium]
MLTRTFQMNCKILLSVFVFISYAKSLSAQQPVSNKQLPQGYEKEAIIALSYFPELKNTHITFRIINAYTPLSTKPIFFSIFKKPAKRKYFITISNQTTDKLSPILFKQLTDSAKIGVLGHELSHVADFQNKHFFQFLHLGLKHSSKKFQDKFEFNTDKICLQHGLGSYLLAWSVFVRNALHIVNWRGADNINEKNEMIERYMNPGTIKNYLRQTLVK